MKKNAGTRLYEKRLEAGWTQAEVADGVGVTQATISNWENNVSTPSSDQTRRLEDLLDSEEHAGPEQDSYGEWLNKARIEKGLSVAELAEQTGVSVPQIYNIESGRSVNPQSTTKDKLESVVGSPPSAEVSQGADQDSTIEGLGTLIDFDPHEKSSWPLEGGVYVFYDISDRPVYVGRTNSIANRFRSHEEKFWFKRPIVERASYIEIGNPETRRWVEQILIKFLKSNAVLNRQMVER